MFGGAYCISNIFIWDTNAIMKKFISILLFIGIIVSIYKCINNNKNYDKILDELESILIEIGEAYRTQDIGRYKKAQQKLEIFDNKYGFLDEDEMTAEQINRAFKMIEDVYTKYQLEEFRNRRITN